ncbi:MAG: hypothetical protein ACHREM_20390 [Polyangiales bacterium]
MFVGLAENLAKLIELLRTKVDENSRTSAVTRVVRKHLDVRAAFARQNELELQLAELSSQRSEAHRELLFVCGHFPMVSLAASVELTC